MTTRNKILAGIAFVAVLGAVLGYLYYSNRSTSPAEGSPSALNGTTTTLDLGDGNTLQVVGGATVKVLSESEAPAAPATNRKVSYPASMDATTRAQIQAAIDTDVAALAKNKTDFASWIDLGLRYKSAGDYEGARLMWEYASAIAPTNVISFNNLGDLYHYHLKNYTKAETNFKQAIKNNPNDAVAYLGLYDLYRLSYQTGSTKAVDTLKQGIEAMKNTTESKGADLMVALARYYRDKGDNASAKIYYSQAITVAQSLNRTDIVNALQMEIANLK